MVDIIKAYKEGRKNVNLLGTDAFKISSPKPKESLPIFLKTNSDIKQYSNEYLYQFEIALRKWLEIKCKDEAWCHNTRARQYTYGMIVEEIFGRPYDVKIDCGHVVVSQMISHYCSRVTKYYYLPEGNYKTKNTTCYHLSPKRYREVKPFGLRLQAELLMQQGIMPTDKNVVRKKPLKKGCARNPRTQANIDKRSKKAKETYLEYQKKYRDSKKEKS